MKQVAALTGVLETTLRVWERRYHVVEPVRSPGGYRLYDDAQVARLRSMAALVADGVPASVAAGSLTDRSAPSTDAAPGSLSDLDLVAAAATLDPAQLDAVLGQAFALAPLEQVADTWLLPELGRLGRAWASGELGVAHEHFASAGVIRALGRAFGEAADAGGGRPVLVGLPPGSRHELGLLAFAACLRRLGVDVVYLGADVPVADWEAAAGGVRARGAVVGATLGARTARTQEVVDRLRTLVPPVAVWVGGGTADRIRDARALPDAVGAAASEVALALEAGSAPHTKL